MAGLSFLTPRELETLLVLLTGRHSKSAISEFFVDERTVRLYLDYLSVTMASALRPRAHGETSQPAGEEPIGELPSKWD